MPRLPNPLLGVVFLIWVIGYVRAVDVKGSIAWNFVCPGIDSLHPQTQVTLDGGRYKSGVRKDGSFIFRDVVPGSYLLQVLARDHIFDQVRVDVLTVEPESSSSSSSSAASKAATDTHPTSSQIVVQVRPVPPGTHFSPNPPNPLLAYPLVLSAHARKVYFVPHEGFNIVEMFKNPMMLMMVFAAVILFVLPKAMESMDPDIVKDMKERQGRILNIQNQLQSGDYNGLASGLLASSGDALKSSSGTPAPRRGGAVGSASPSRANASSTTGPGKKAAGGGGGGGGSGSKKKR